MFTVAQIKDHLIGMGHGSTLNRVRNIEALFERSASVFLQKCKPLETWRIASLTDLIHDDLNDYDLPDDFSSLIDLAPQDERELWDKAFRNPAGQFDLEKAFKNKTISIEGNEGAKIIRINWKTRTPTGFHAMDSLTADGTWSAVASASGLVADEITKRKGGASIRFDVSATGDGIQNTGIDTKDFTDHDEVGDLLFDLYIKNSTDLANFNSITPRWGNDLSSNYWTANAQTARADGSALRVGWNPVKASWTTATETGTVDPATIDSLRFVVDVDAAIGDIRIDNVRMSIGRAFEMKYHSKFLFKNSAGTYISQPTSDDDNVLIDNDSLPLFLFEFLKAMAHQTEGEDSMFDIEFAKSELKELYPAFRSEFPDQRVKQSSRYGGRPRFQR